MSIGACLWINFNTVSQHIEFYLVYNFVNNYWTENVFGDP